MNFRRQSPATKTLGHKFLRGRRLSRKMADFFLATLAQRAALTNTSRNLTARGPSAAAEGTASRTDRLKQPPQTALPSNQVRWPGQAAGSVGTADSSAAAAASSRCFSLRIAQYSNTIGSTLTKMIPSVTKKKLSWTAGMLPTQ